MRLLSKAGQVSSALQIPSLSSSSKVPAQPQSSVYTSLIVQAFPSSQGVPTGLGQEFASLNSIQLRLKALTTTSTLIT